MQLHQLSPIKKHQTKKRVGRGGKRGTYSGRGLKGQKARAGRKLRPQWRDMLKRIPKRRGYRFKSIKQKPQILNFSDLVGVFKEGELVSPVALIQKGLTTKMKGRRPEVKILGGGELNKKLNFKGVALSKSARDKIEKVGGSIR